MTEGRDAIMAATHRALCAHGYADLTMQRIADEADVTTAALHYHYDTKAELLTAFLDHLLETFRHRFDERLAEEEVSGPVERLEAFLDEIFAPHIGENAGDFETALLEIKAQGPYDEAFRATLREHDEYMRRVVEDCVAEGVETDAFHDVDPVKAARFIVTTINGTHVRQVALGEDPTEARDALYEYVETNLLRDAEVSLT